MSQINLNEQNVIDERRKKTLMKKHFIYFMILNILFILTISHTFNSILVSENYLLEFKCYVLGLINVRFIA